MRAFTFRQLAPELFCLFFAASYQAYQTQTSQQHAIGFWLRYWEWSRVIVQCRRHMRHYQRSGE
jgi:hypothetical protein